MTIDANACGVLATIIPVYTLVLYVGRERLMQAPPHRFATATVMAAVVFVTLAEVMVIAGLVTGRGLGEPFGYLVSVVTTSAVFAAGSSAALDIWGDSEKNRAELARLRQAEATLRRRLAQDDGQDGNA